MQALAAATVEFARGAIGAGRGMSCFGLKGGIGTASRVTNSGAMNWTLGALVLANFGRLETLTLNGRNIGPVLAARLARRASIGASPQRDQGSIIVILATDAPLDHRHPPSPPRRSRHRTHGVVLRSWRHRARVFHCHNRPARCTANPRCARITEIELDPLFEAAAEATERDRRRCSQRKRSRA
jgi:D-aminopeptidase